MQRRTYQNQPPAVESQLLVWERPSVGTVQTWVVEGSGEGQGRMNGQGTEDFWGSGAIPWGSIKMDTSRDTFVQTHWVWNTKYPPRWGPKSLSFHDASVLVPWCLKKGCGLAGASYLYQESMWGAGSERKLLLSVQFWNKPKATPKRAHN